MPAACRCCATASSWPVWQPPARRSARSCRRGSPPRWSAPRASRANPEDLLVAYAMDVTYVGQHGDDRARWEARFGDLVVSPDDSLGMKAAPVASRQHELSWAISLCDRVVAAAEAARAPGLRRRRRPRWRPHPAGPDGRRRRRGSGRRPGDCLRGGTVRDPERAPGPRPTATAAASRAAPDAAPFLAAPGGLPLGWTVGSSAAWPSAASTRRCAQGRWSAGRVRVTGTASPVRVAMLGCGAIGSLYAAHLAQRHGVEVWAGGFRGRSHGGRPARRAARDRDADSSPRCAQ